MSETEKQLMAALKSIVERYSELMGRDATHHEFSCCIESAERLIKRIELRKQFDPTPAIEVSGGGTMDDATYLNIGREYFNELDERHFLFAKDVWNAALAKAKGETR